MSGGRLVPPRRQGLLGEVSGGRTQPVRRSYPYAVGDRIAGDLTVFGHLSPGRFAHLYQVWSAGEWAAFTCKILSPKLRDDRRARAALRREARILRPLRHPNIVRTFGQGEHDGLPFLLMEYLEGPSLFEVLESRPKRMLGVADAVRTALHAGAAIYQLHRRGFVHLDLKPANLLFRDSIPVLVDFDAARPILPARSPSWVPGTAPYMAPEQVRREPPTPAADIYGLGAVLYEMVTGRWPFEAVYQEEEPRTGVERQYPQLGLALPPPPRAFNPEVPEALERTILRCLAPQPADRFESMHQLLLALVTVLDGPEALWPHGVYAERRSAPRH